MSLMLLPINRLPLAHIQPHCHFILVCFTSFLTSLSKCVSFPRSSCLSLFLLWIIPEVKTWQKWFLERVLCTCLCQNMTQLVQLKEFDFWSWKFASFLDLTAASRPIVLCMDLSSNQLSENYQLLVRPRTSKYRKCGHPHKQSLTCWGDDILDYSEFLLGCEYDASFGECNMFKRLVKYHIRVMLFSVVLKWNWGIMSCESNSFRHFANLVTTDVDRDLRSMHWLHNV